MMNRPRPRKIVSVIKTSPSAEAIEEKTLEDKKFIQNSSNEQRKMSLDSISNDFKPQSPVVPSFSSGTTARSPPTTTPTNSSQTASFVSRKPVVATLKKAHVPPPPTFSDSPKSSPASLSKTEKIEFEKPKSFPIPSNNFNSASSPTEQKLLSPKSSGEAFLDAADKAADFIGGALLNSFKNFNLTDTASVKMTSSNEPEIKDEEEDPFADIMKKLKTQQLPKPSVDETVSSKKVDFVNLMDEEPPETFKQFNEQFVIPVKSPIKPKQPEPSSFIKAAFSPKSTGEPLKGNEKEKETDKEQEHETNLSFNHEINSSESLKQNFNIMDEQIIQNIKVEENEKVTNETVIAEESTDEIFRDTEIISLEEEPKFFEKSKESIVHELEDKAKIESNINNQTFDETESQEYSTALQSSFEQPHLESPIVHEPNPFINFDGSVSSGPIQVQEIEQMSSTSTIPFFDSLSSIISSNSDSSSISSPTNSYIKSPTSPQAKTTGFRASILKHGLSALEKIGKSTADVVVSTRNKLTEPSITQFTSSQQQPQHQPITPDFTDENSSFYDILKLYGGYAKLQELQLKGVKASISMKLAHKNEKIERSSSFDYQSRLKIRREVSNILHPDRIMENIDDSEPSTSNLIFSKDFDMKFKNFSKFEDEIFCIQKLLKSLENILIVSNDEEVLISSNRRRHSICQISTVFITLLQKLILIQSTSSASVLEISKEISIFTSQIIKYLQTNFSRNCENYPRADRDQQLAIKLILDISYSTVPQLQQLQ